MATVIENRHISVTGSACEPDFGILHSALIEVDPDYGLEAGALEGFGDILGIVGRVGQMRCVCIGSVADH
jgi:hypothetical protein